MTQADGRPWSCDSFVILPGSTADGSMLLGTNSDRPVDEVQPLRYVPARSPSRADRLRLAYVEIADDRETLAHVGASPYWCWGHELGVNECGVAVGNEALSPATSHGTRTTLGPATRPSRASSGWSCFASDSNGPGPPPRRWR